MRRTAQKRWLTLCFMSMLLVVIGLEGSAWAQVPDTITHQGRLYDDVGQPVSNTLDVEFAIYSGPATGAPLWSETHSITFDEGYFSVALGSLTPFSATTFDGSLRYLGITVGADPEMSPRVTVASVPYALVAGDVRGDIHPTSVEIPGAGIVINSNGQWVGSPTGLQGPQGPQGPAGPAGLQGPAGADGAQGPAGADGAQGPAGADGAQGAAGADGGQGIQGNPGPQGIQGPLGAQGPSGVISATFVSGAGSTPTTTTSFLATPVSVAVTAGEVVHVTSHKAFGSTAAGGADSLNLYICYQSSTAASPTVMGGGSWGQTVAPNMRTILGLSTVIDALPTDTYQVGLCGSSTDAVNWNWNEWGYTSAVVARQ